MPALCRAVMLILSRKVGQSIVINGNVVVKVLSMDQGNVRLGIQAPPEVQVHREEIQRQRVTRGCLRPAERRRSRRWLGLPE